MKSFREQTNQMAAWFAQWNLSEQTIALYALLARVSAEQSRFLSLVLENNLRAKNSVLAETERQANDPEYISSLARASPEPLASYLIPRLLLLQPGNAEARQAYFKLLPVVLSTVIVSTGSTNPDPAAAAAASSHATRHQHYDDCRQLLSLILVHPAFPVEEKLAVRGWLAQLEEQARPRTRDSPPGPIGTIPANHHPPPPHHQRWSSVGGGGSFKGDSANVDSASVGPINQVFPATNGHRLPVGLPAGFSQRDHRSQSLMMRNAQQSLGGGTVGGEAGLDESEVRLRSQSFPVSAFMHGEGSRQQQQPQQQGPWTSSRAKGIIGFEKPGMRDVPVWLKSLRLHKYQELFAQLSFDEMMVLTEEELEEKNVTKGARHKIVGSIQKLKERGNQLDSMEEEVSKPGRLPQIIQDLKTMIITPIKPPNHPSEDKLSPSAVILHSNSDSQLNLIQQQVLREAAANGCGNSLDAESVPPCASPTSPPPAPLGEKEHLTVKFVRVLKKVCHQLLQTATDEDLFGTFLSILDKTLMNEAFGVNLRKIVFSLKDHCQKDPRRFYRRQSNDMKGPQRSGSHGSHGNLAMSAQSKSATLPQSNRQRRTPLRLPLSGAASMGGNPVVTVPPHLMGVSFMPTQPPPPSSGMNVGGAASRYRTSSMNSRPPHPRQMDPTGFVRTYSGPPSLPIDKGYGPNLDYSVGERDHYMETLCRQVTEHALSDSSERSSAY